MTARRLSDVNKKCYDSMCDSFGMVGDLEKLMRTQDEREFQDSLISERDAQIRTIQGQMVEVNDIFKDLARLVEDQGEMVGASREEAKSTVSGLILADNIQTNVTTAATHVDTAVSELKTASEYQESSRKKLCFIAVRRFLYG